MDHIYENCHVQETDGATPADREIEIVERKGVGHPDTICDLVTERISQALWREYRRRCGRVMHYNCDKGLLVAGRVERCFGGGRVIEPMRLIIGDRATLVNEFDVGQLAVETAKEWFRENLPGVDSERHLEFQVELKGGSEELTGIFRRSESMPVANDTAAAVGYAPLTETERMAIDAERFLNAAKFKISFPESGSDVKIMAVRRGERLSLTAAMPLVDKFVANEDDYFRRKEEMKLALVSYLRSRRDKVDEVTVEMNTLDRREAGPSGIYLSVLGTSAEDADSGGVGRGNQVNGLISLNRPRGSEAAAGKNPVSHVGKIYNVLSHLLARQIYHEVSGLREVIVWLCGRIGDPVDSPHVISVQVKLAKESTLADVADPIRRIVAREFARMPLFCQALAQGKYPIC
jgi:S-adenosylmethionine synthetase